ncbi:MAG: hypothetical protein ABF641_11845, partial [Acetobacter sp.]
LCSGRRGRRFESSHSDHGFSGKISLPCGMRPECYVFARQKHPALAEANSYKIYDNAFQSVASFLKSIDVFNKKPLMRL